MCLLYKRVGHIWRNIVVSGPGEMRCRKYMEISMALRRYVYSEGPKRTLFLLRRPTRRADLVDLLDFPLSLVFRIPRHLVSLEAFAVRDRHCD